MSEQKLCQIQEKDNLVSPTTQEPIEIIIGLLESGDKCKLKQFREILHTRVAPEEMPETVSAVEDLNSSVCTRVRREQIESEFDKLKVLEEYGSKIDFTDEDKFLAVLESSVRKQIKKLNPNLKLERKKSSEILKGFKISKSDFLRKKCSSAGKKKCLCAICSNIFIFEIHGLCATFATFQNLISSLGFAVKNVQEVQDMFDVVSCNKPSNREERLELIKKLGSLAFERGFDLVVQLANPNTGALAKVLKGVLKADDINIEEIIIEEDGLKKKISKFLSSIQYDANAMLAPLDFGGALVIYRKEIRNFLKEGEQHMVLFVEMLKFPKIIWYRHARFILCGFQSEVSFERDGEPIQEGLCNHAAFTQKLIEKGKERWVTISNDKVFSHENLDKHRLPVKSFIYKPI